MYHSNEKKLIETIVLKNDYCYNDTNSIQYYNFQTAKWIKNSRRTYTESPAATNTFPISLFFRGCPHDTCVICLDDYVEGDELQVMPCNHGEYCII